MSDIMNIPQIPAAPIENLQNDLHIGFTATSPSACRRPAGPTRPTPRRCFPPPSTR